MKKRRLAFVFIVFSIVLYGCMPNQERLEEEPMKIKVIEDHHYERVVGLISDRTIAYIASDSVKSALKTVDLFTGKVETIVEKEGEIQNVYYHSKAKQYFVQWTSDIAPYEAELYDAEGRFIYWFPVKGVELYVNWNEDDASQLLLTTFNEDWSYETYHYDIALEHGRWIASPSPFPIWWNDSIVYYDESQKRVVLQNGKTLNVAGTYVGLYSVGQTLVGIFQQDKQYQYVVWDEKGREKETWTSPVVGDEWTSIIPIVQKKERELIIYAATTKTEGVRYTIQGETQRVSISEVDTLPTTCGEKSCFHEEGTIMYETSQRWMKNGGD